MSLYEEIGGDAAIEAALDRFYPRVLGDPRLSGFFAHVDLARLKTKQRAFLAMAFGGPQAYDGRDLRTAHQRPVREGLNEVLFEVFMGHFRATLEELGVPAPQIGRILAIAEGGRAEVLGR